VILDRTFKSLLLVIGRVRYIGQNVLQCFLVTGRICNIGQDVLHSSVGNWENT